MNNEYKVIKVLIGIVYADDYLHEKEFYWLEKLIKNSPLSQTEKDQLLDELKGPKEDNIAVFKTIDNYYSRCRVINFSRCAFNIDGNFSSQEKTTYQYLVSIQSELSKKIIKDQNELAKAIILGEKSKLFYEELKELGDTLSEKPPFSHRPLSKKFVIVIFVVYILYHLILTIFSLEY